MRIAIKHLLLCLLLPCFFSTRSAAQKSSANVNVLENILSSVVTVAVFETDFAKKSLGFRGDPSDLAYAKMLDLSGATGSGSGFLINCNGQPYIITNAHVIEEASDKDGSIYVYSISRTKYKAKVVGGDSFYDIAILEFVDKPGPEFSFLEMRLAPARIGEKVFAIGNPLGEYPYSVSDGIISAKNRVRGGLTGKFGFLQTTATVIWGNSGGPLVDEEGKVVGINSQIAFANQGNTSIWQPQINFALEAPLAKRLIDEVLANGIVGRCFLGIELVQKKLAYAPDSKEYAYYSRSVEQNKRPVINNVLDHSPAGVLKPFVGYEVVSIDNEEVRNLEEALGKFEELKPGQRFILTIQKNGQSQKLTITPDALTSEAAAKIGEGFLKQADATYLQNNRNVLLTFKSSSEKAIPIGASIRGESTKNELLSGEWQVLGMGLYSQGQEAMWRIADLADIGTAARLTGLTGIVDIALFRKGSNPDVADNYKMKRVNLSPSEHLLQQTLWY